MTYFEALYMLQENKAGRIYHPGSDYTPYYKLCKCGGAIEEIDGSEGLAPSLLSMQRTDWDYIPF